MNHGLLTRIFLINSCTVVGLLDARLPAFSLLIIRSNTFKALTWRNYRKEYVFVLLVNSYFLMTIIWQSYDNPNDNSLSRPSAVWPCLEHDCKHVALYFVILKSISYIIWHLTSRWILDNNNNRNNRNNRSQSFIIIAIIATSIVIRITLQKTLIFEICVDY